MFFPANILLSTEEAKWPKLKHKNTIAQNGS